MDTWVYTFIWNVSSHVYMYPALYWRVHMVPCFKTHSWNMESVWALAWNYCTLKTSKFCVQYFWAWKLPNTQKLQFKAFGRLNFISIISSENPFFEESFFSQKHKQSTGFIHTVLFVQFSNIFLKSAVSMAHFLF